MKKILLALTIAAMALCSCSKDDNSGSIKYDETLGYLTNPASVKHGILGEWQVVDVNPIFLVFNANGSFVIQNPSVNATETYTYTIVKKGSDYYVTITNPKTTGESRISRLTKAQLILRSTDGDDDVLSCIRKP